MECQKMNITPKVILSNFRSFPISPVRESCSSLFLDFPPWGKSGFRCFLIFPREGNLFSADFLFSPVRESRFLPIFACRTPTKTAFSRFSFIVPLRKPLFLVFRSSYPYESLLFSFFVHRIPTKASFSRFSFIVSRIWVVFRKNWWLCPVYRQFFPKSEEKTISLLRNEFWNGLFLLVCFR